MRSAFLLAIVAAKPFHGKALHTFHMLALLGAVVGFTVFGDISMKHGLDRVGGFRELRPRSVLRSIGQVARSGWVLMGVAGMAGSFFTLLVLLSAAPVSAVIPATAASFVIETLGARLILKEKVTGMRWVGAALVAAGVALVAR